MSRRGQDGQATVEFALVLPLLGLVLLAVVQIGVVVDAQIRTTHAAREGARAAAVGAEAVDAARRALGRGDPAVEVSSDGAVVRVSVVHLQETSVPLVGRLLGDIELRAEATMLRENDN